MLASFRLFLLLLVFAGLVSCREGQHLDDPYNLGYIGRHDGLVRRIIIEGDEMTVAQFQDEEIETPVSSYSVAITRSTTKFTSQDATISGSFIKTRVESIQMSWIHSPDAVESVQIYALVLGYYSSTTKETYEHR